VIGGTTCVATNIGEYLVTSSCRLAESALVLGAFWNGVVSAAEGYVTCCKSYDQALVAASLTGDGSMTADSRVRLQTVRNSKAGERS
jgi:hypothetical protein